jgi:hypothetical protein
LTCVCCSQSFVKRIALDKDEVPTMLADLDSAITKLMWETQAYVLNVLRMNGPAGPTLLPALDDWWNNNVGWGKTSVKLSKLVDQLAAWLHNK